MSIKTSILGIPEMSALLKDLRDDTFKKKVLTSSYRKAAKPFVKLARSKAPVADDYVFRKNGDAIAPGTLKKSIGTWTYRKMKTPHLMLGAKFGRRSLKYDGWFYRFIEFGTVHQSAKPFLRPAWDATQGFIGSSINNDFSGIFNKFKNKHGIK